MSNIEPPLQDTAQDLFTHLTVIKGYVQMAQRTASHDETSPRLPDYLGKALSEIDALTLLVTALHGPDAAVDAPDDPSTRDP
jgi:hypothetical protein